MMLDEKTLEWLERRKNLCTHCGVKKCVFTLSQRQVFGWCDLFEVKAPGTKTGRLCEDFRDAAEFEARVARKLCDPFWNYVVAEQYFELALPYRRLPAAFVLKTARLEVEAEMIAEGKGPGRPEDE